MKKKVLIISLDGATWDLIGPWTKEGKLPTIRGLMKTEAKEESEVFTKEEEGEIKRRLRSLGYLD